MMANLGGLISGMQAPDEFPDTKKANPRLFEQLGIPNPNEQADQAAKQAQIMQLLQQQVEQQRQQNAIQKASVRPTAFPMLSAMGLNIPNAQQKAPQQGPQGQGGFDPSSIVSQEFQRSPNDPVGAKKRAGVKLLQMAIQTGNPNLQDIATNILQRASDEERAANKENIDNQAKQSETGSRSLADQIKVNQLGNPGTPFQEHSGIKLRTRVPTFNKDGSFKGFVTDSEGINKQFTQTDEDPRTQAQKGEDYKEFRQYTENSDATIAKAKELKRGLKAGAAQGWTSDAVTVVGNVSGALRQLAPGNPTLDDKAEKFLGGKSGTFKDWFGKTSVNESVWADLVSSLAKTYNTGGAVTEKDITRAMGVVGRNLSDPKAVTDVLNEVINNTGSSVDRKYKYLSEDAQTASKKQYETFKDTTRDWVSNPPKTKADYDRIPVGDEYYNPHLKKTVTKRG